MISKCQSHDEKRSSGVIHEEIKLNMQCKNMQCIEKAMKLIKRKKPKEKKRMIRYILQMYMLSGCRDIQYSVIIHVYFFRMSLHTIMLCVKTYTVLHACVYS